MANNSESIFEELIGICVNCGADLTSHICYMCGYSDPGVKNTQKSIEGQLALDEDNCIESGTEQVNLIVSSLLEKSTNTDMYDPNQQKIDFETKDIVFHLHGFSSEKVYVKDGNVCKIDFSASERKMSIDIINYYSNDDYNDTGVKIISALKLGDIMDRDSYKKVQEKELMNKNLENFCNLLLARYHTIND